MRTYPVRSRSHGFTLFEMLLAMGLLGILVGMVFTTARTSLALGNTIVKTQNEEMLHQAFFELLSQRFSALPGNTRMELKSSSTSSHYLSDLTLQNVPMSFTWGGEAKIAKAIQLTTVKRRSGFLDIVLRYYEEEILKDSNAKSKKRAGEEKPFEEIVLLSDVAYFEWRVLDGRSMEWGYDWDIQGRLPLQMELTVAIGATGEEMRQVFWLPPKQNPELMIRQMVESGSPTGDENGTTPPPIAAPPGPGGQPLNFPAPPP